MQLAQAFVGGILQLAHNLTLSLLLQGAAVGFGLTRAFEVRLNFMHQVENCSELICAM
jgi:hypothetical protein